MRENNSKRWGAVLAEQLREQVGNLMAAAQLLTPAIQEREDRKYSQYLGILNQSLYRLLRLTEQVDFAAQGEIRDFRPAPVDIAHIVQDLGAQVEPLAEHIGVSFDWEIEGHPLLLLGDEDLLRRMLLNLIANALKAAGAGGRAGMRLTGEGKRGRIAVWDDGPKGVLPGGEGAELPLEALLKEREGLGLGLEIAREIARLHGGALILERGENRGLRAVVSLPGGLEDLDTLRTPRMGFDATGGFSQVLVELSQVLPFDSFLPEDVE
ncbi:sensor histidine kinase [Pseudoflavonifractor sp. 524-17]|uniref:sensor histidine kinase n=1 Tax=Pseudoflavonifractor sp. 524-17 TaxID=2304577 RepID=UPI00137A0BC4|nr:HAMP domain-containing sensor histidine kinase [Pseudoflavonifractor sp. 524-17]NCE64730.1 sensor histidine kinase [Pseudoflavonifractor sp. 524-17]